MNKNSRTVNSTYNIVSNLISYVILTLLSFACRTVFIKTLGREYLGINGLFSDVLNMLSLTELGIGIAFDFKMYKPLAEGDVNRLSAIMNFYRLAYLLVGTVIAVVGCALIPFLPYLVKDYDTFSELGLNPIFIFSLYLVNSVSSYLFFSYKNSIIKADQKQYIATIVRFFVKSAVYGFQIVFLLRYKNFISYTILEIGGTILSNAIGSIIATKLYSEVFKQKKIFLPKSEIYSTFKDLGALFLSRVNNVVLKATDNIVLSSFKGLTFVGQYSNYLYLYSSLLVVLNGLLESTKDSIGNLLVSAEKKKKKEFFDMLNFVTVVLYGTACAGFFVVGDELISLFAGPDYIIGGFFSLIIGIEIYSTGLKTFLALYRNTSGLFIQGWYRPLVGIIVNIISSVIFVNICGIHGVILGTVLADICSNFVFDPRLLYKYVFDKDEKLFYFYLNNIIDFILIIIAGFLFKWICLKIVLGNGWLSFFVHFLLCIIFFPCVYLVTHFKMKCCKDAMQYIKKIIERFVLNGKNKKRNI